LKPQVLFSCIMWENREVKWGRCMWSEHRARTGRGGKENMVHWLYKKKGCKVKLNSNNDT